MLGGWGLAQVFAKITIAEAIGEGGKARGDTIMDISFPVEWVGHLWTLVFPKKLRTGSFGWD